MVWVQLTAISVLRDVSQHFGESSLRSLRIGFPFQSLVVDGPRIWVAGCSGIHNPVGVLVSHNATVGGYLHRRVALADMKCSYCAGLCDGAHAE